MAGRLRQVTELYETELQRVTAERAEWMGFLRFAAAHYQYSFDQQLLLYAQRPEATVVLPMEDWNLRYGRWVARGAKAIAVFDENYSSRRQLRFLFDIADTVETNQTRPIPRFEVLPDERPGIVDALEDAVGELAERDSFEQALCSVAQNVVRERMPEIMREVLVSLDGSFLESCTDEEIENVFSSAVAENVGFVLLTKCGCEPERVMGEDAFAALAVMDTPLLGTALGTAVSFISRDILIEVVHIQRSLKTQEFAAGQQALYNETVEETTQKSESRDAHERSEEHGDHLHDAERVPDSGFGDAGGADRAQPLGQDAVGLPSEAAENPIHAAADEREADAAPAAGADGHGGAARQAGAADGEGGEPDRAVQGTGAAGVGPANERHPQDGGRAGHAGDHGLSDAGGEARRQKETRARAGRVIAPPALAVSLGYQMALDLEEALPEGTTAQYEQQRITQRQIDRALTDSCRTFAGGQEGIVPFLAEHDSQEERVRFIRGRYGIGGMTVGERLYEGHSGKGMEIKLGGLLEPEDQVLLSWRAVAERLAQLYQQEILEAMLPDETEEPALNVEPATYHISETQQDVSRGPKARFLGNLDAIRTLKAVEVEGRVATPEEQEVLAQYVGWGGLADAFDPNKDGWREEYRALKDILTDAEYAAARASTLTAFYTPPVVIQAMYAALGNMGFSGGNLLEPACGTGRFFGMLPEGMGGAHCYGVELDSVSGRIAQLLYPEAHIQVKGYEQSDLPDQFFDAAVGNVPFGAFSVADRRYDAQHFLIHDYFFARTLDKLRPGGVLAFVTAKGTMDKENLAVRRYIAQRAELVGAIRLPNDTFHAEAGADVTSDILFLRKRERPVVEEPDWVHLGRTESELTVNRYFTDHPEMVLGELVEVTTQYGRDVVCKPFPHRELKELLAQAVEALRVDDHNIQDAELSDAVKPDGSIPADPTVRNYSYTAINGRIYYRENSRMMPVQLSRGAQERVLHMLPLRDCVRELIQAQLDDEPDTRIAELQHRLNGLYDGFRAEFGLLSGRANSQALSDDSAYPLLCSLEILDENGQLARKADLFTRRTIQPHRAVTHADSAGDALAVSLSEKGRVDLHYMEELSGKPPEELTQALRGMIFPLPKHPGRYVTADEYLSGNVREKLREARRAAQEDARFNGNVTALEAAQPQDIPAAEISVRLGATWVPPEIVEQFVLETLQPPFYARRSVHVHYSEVTAQWRIEGKNVDRFGVLATQTYGTEPMNAYRIVEETLNLHDARVYDAVERADGSKSRVLNKRETALAQARQEQLKAAFADWVWKEPERRERLAALYNERFNAIRLRTYDGSGLRFAGMNPEIRLRPHQADAVAHGLYGGNTLLAHVVGAGKTYTMAAAAQESRRMGLCSKSLFVVPNHLTEQWAAEYLQLYPAANLLVAAKKDFEARNRRRFCSRIATGDYDAVIIGHSQFEKIPLSVERQQRFLQEQIDELARGMEEVKAQSGGRFTVKQMERSRKSLEVKLKKLTDAGKKDDVVTFEELGVDRLFVDEAHLYKNLFVVTKMRNVAGVGQSESQKASDLFMKCRYLDEITGGRGVVFATGTPISNSMTELYTMQRYLQYDRLSRQGLQHFDAWASTFGETVTAIELAPEGTGYRAKTRFSRFYNLPELMTLFREVADIQTADMLKLPVPKAQIHNVAIPPTEQQKRMVESLSERAEQVRSGNVSPEKDNMLRITNDGRKLALDQRLMQPLLPDAKNSKVSVCAQNIQEIWQRTKADRSAQLVFCDLSTPGAGFNVYDDLRDKLVEKGIPKEEIAYIHDANTEVQKKELFARVRSGQVRVLMGSTAKMGAGTNVQERLIALHDLDCPWRPSDLEQRAGRILRQGNRNPEVHIYRYVTEQTFDAYLYQLVENKQRFISQIMTSKSPARVADDVDEASLSYAEIKALATGNPLIREKMDAEVTVARLRMLRASHMSRRYALEDRLRGFYPAQVAGLRDRIARCGRDVELLRQSAVPEGTFPPMVVFGKPYARRNEAAKAFWEACRAAPGDEPARVGSWRGFELEVQFEPFTREVQAALVGAERYNVALGSDPGGNLTRMENRLENIPEELCKLEMQLSDTQRQIEDTHAEVQRPFPQEEELRAKEARLAELNALLNLDEKDAVLLDEAEPEEERDEKALRVAER